MKSDHLVLAASDLSAPARHAAERAARVAQDSGAALALLHVMPAAPVQQLREWLGASSGTEQQLRDESRQQLQALAARLQAQFPIHIRTLDSCGPVLQDIQQQADQLDAALVVVGARGAGYLRRLMLGGTAERLLRRTTRPVLVVRQTAHESYRRVLVALDFSPWSAQALALARRVAPQARLVLFSAYQVPFEGKLQFAGVNETAIRHYREQMRVQATQRVHALAAASGLQAQGWEACIVEGEAAQCILEQEQEQDCDLVVMGKHGQSMTEDLLLGSVSRHVLSEGSTDVLVSTAHAA